MHSFQSTLIRYGKRNAKTLNLEAVVCGEACVTHNPSQMLPGAMALSRLLDRTIWIIAEDDTVLESMKSQIYEYRNKTICKIANLRQRFRLVALAAQGQGNYMFERTICDMQSRGGYVTVTDMAYGTCSAVRLLTVSAFAGAEQEDTTYTTELGHRGTEVCQRHEFTWRRNHCDLWRASTPSALR